MTVAEKILSFCKTLDPGVAMPRGIGIMNPYQDPKTYAYASLFYRKFYNDTATRKIILGINPGRFGAGITGVPFTDPVKLQTICGIDNDLQKKTELSADFVYAVVAAWEGPEAFYKDFFIGALSPLGFTRDGRNLNYYDDRALEKRIAPFIVECLRRQIRLGVDTSVAYCLGEGENYRYLMKVNDVHGFFGRVVALPHPRFIMQYRRKRLQEFVDLYVRRLSGAG